MNYLNLQTKDKGLRLVNVKHHIAETRNSKPETRNLNFPLAVQTKK